jgi:hypothetical protein
VYYIEDVDTCTDEFAVLIYRSMLDRVKQILTSCDVIDYYKNTDLEIYGFDSINRGHCEDVAGYTYEKIKKSSFDVSRVRVLCLFQNNSPDYDNTQHTWIEYTSSKGNIYHFDSLVPWGVKNIMHIPIMYSSPWATQFTFTVKEIDPYNDISEQIAGVYGFEYDIKEKNPGFSWGDDTDARH